MKVHPSANTEHQWAIIIEETGEILDIFRGKSTAITRNKDKNYPYTGKRIIIKITNVKEYKEDLKRSVTQTK